MFYFLVTWKDYNIHLFGQEEKIVFYKDKNAITYCDNIAKKFYSEFIDDGVINWGAKDNGDLFFHVPSTVLIKIEKMPYGDYNLTDEERV